MKNFPKCIECNKILSRYDAIRCWDCSHKPENCKGFIDGRTAQIYICKDCNNIISYKNARHGKGRCLSCAIKNMYIEHPELKINLSNKMKKRLKNPENHPSYIHGKTCQIAYCTCGKKLHKQAVLYGTIRCKKCWHEIRKLLIIGEGNSNWQGGISKFPYAFEFNDILKESIRDRDNHECQLCHTKEQDLNIKLCIHHIDYNKLNCLEINLTSLCNSCNSKVNFERDYYYAYFTYKIKEIYGKCICNTN